MPTSLSVDEAKLHRDGPEKIASAFFKMSRSSLTRELALQPPYLLFIRLQVPLGVDPLKRLLYVAAYGGGLYLVDFNRAPSIGLLKANHDGTDDRVLTTVPLKGNTDAPVFLVPELGLAYAGGLARGVTSIAVAGRS